MNAHDACEQAYQNGYYKGKAEEKNAAKEIAELETKCHQLQKERDALFEVAERCHHCADCKYYNVGWDEEPCSECRNNIGHTLHWEWRGVND